jgi:hypothetical protein
MRGGDAGERSAREYQASRLVALARAGELFHTPTGDPFATVPVGQHRETRPLRSAGFRRWLAQRFYQVEGAVPGYSAMLDALKLLEGQAEHEGPEHL